jgi:hypothetical protein
MRHLRHALATLITLSMLGCTNQPVKVSNAFDDLVNETNRTGTSLVDYRSFLSVSGLAPIRFVGMFLIHPPGVSPTHAVGVSPKWSHYVVTDYPLAEDERARIGGIAAKYHELVTAADAVTIQRLLVAAADEAHEKSSNAKDEALCTVLGIGTGASCTAESSSKALEAHREKLNSLTTAFQQAKAAFNKDANIRNAIIMRWQKSSEDAGDGAYGSVIGGGYRAAKARGGIAIYADLRVETLYLGEDFLDMVRQFNDAAQKWVFTRTSIPTYQVKAKFVEYVSDGIEDSGLRFAAKLSVSQLETIKKLLTDKSDATVLSANWTTSLLSDVGNRGRLQDSITQTFPFCFFSPRAHQEDLARLVTQSSGYSTVYGVEAQLQHLLSILLSVPETDLTRILAMPVSDPKRHSLLSEYQSQCRGDAKWNTFEPPFNQYYERATQGAQRNQ